MKHIGIANNGSEIIQIELKREDLSIKLLSLGACLQDLRLEAFSHSLVLGYPDANSYLSNVNYFGATIGPFANRLANGQAVVLGKLIELDRNTQNGDHLHGGLDGVHLLNWNVIEHSNYHVIFELNVESNHMGLPGNMNILTTYKLLEDQSLEVDIVVQSDISTLCSFCHHSYFNLTGRADISGHQLQVFADLYLPVNQNTIPTGEITSVVNTNLDFRQKKNLSLHIPLDHNFCISNKREHMRKVAILSTLDQRLEMHLFSTEPGLQVFTGQGIKSDGPIGNSGSSYIPFSGVALEPQLWPDAPHHDAFPSAILLADNVYRNVSKFTFKQN